MLFSRCRTRPVERYGGLEDPELDFQHISASVLGEESLQQAGAAAGLLLQLTGLSIVRWSSQNQRLPYIYMYRCDLRPPHRSDHQVGNTSHLDLVRRL